MKEGDIVVCIDNVIYSLIGEEARVVTQFITPVRRSVSDIYYITIGKSYNVYRTFADHIIIIGDNDLPAKYSKHRFELLSKVRDEKITKIIDKIK
jgi:hypothetical protein